MSWEYLTGVLKIFDIYPKDADLCPGDIWSVSWR